MPGFRFDNLSIFLSKKNSYIPFYQKLHLYSELEELDSPVSQLSKVINSISIRCFNNFNCGNHFGLLCVKKKGSYKAQDIVLPREFSILELEKHLFSFISSSLKIKLLLPINDCLFKIILIIFL